MGETRCRICGNADDNRDFQVREMMFGTRESFRYFQCSRCGCLQIAVIPPDMSRYYPADYYSLKVFSLPAQSGRHAVKWRLKRLRDRYVVLHRGIIGRVLARLFPTWDEDLGSVGRASLPARPRILDLGCGGGLLLLKLRALGIRDLLGIDPYLDKDIRYPDGLTIRKAPIEEAEGTWDLVMLHHSLEHMPDQSAALGKAARLLARDGTCLVRVPVTSSFAWEHYRENWSQVDAPRHLYLHSVASLELAAGKVGLRLKEVIHDSNAYQFILSEQYARNIPMYPWLEPPLFSDAEIAEFKKRADQLNRQGRGDQAAFYFVKNASRAA